MTESARIELSSERIAAFCHKWKVREFSLFGSVLRDDFGPDSDVDVLISFESDAQWSLFDWVEMIDELESGFGRPVHLFAEAGLRNPFRRREIMKTRKIFYGAGQA